ncbi:B12-binding domain-containing radical SAM protein [bacterium]|nr:radical SAM protein [bacterium]MBU3956312.1 B12-binding domain-containing radical SAM protein [bacterium]
MNILFIVPPVTMEERYGKLAGVGSSYPSLGLAYIAAVAEQLNHNVKVLDAAALQLSMEEVGKFIMEFDPDIVGLQTFFTTVQHCYAVASLVKKISGRTKIICGGPQATGLPEEFLKRDEIDFVVRGEGEIVFHKFLEAFEAGTGYEQIQGLCWKNGGQLIITPPAPLVINLDDVPFPAWHLFPMDKYRSPADRRGSRVIHMMTSRGCPFRCRFCATNLTFGRTYRYHSADRVIQEMKYLKERYKPDEIHFFDDIFTLNRARTLELCQKMKNEIRLPWACETRVNTVGLNLLKQMKEAGCYKISYGVESGSTRLLKLIRKDITLEQCRRAFRYTKQAGIETMGLFMLALPGETREDSFKTINFALELNPDFVQFAITAPFKGTDLYDLALNYGKILTDDPSRYTSWDIVYVPQGRTKEEILATVRTAYRKFYMRPLYMAKRLFNLRKYCLFNTYRLFKTGVKILLG